MVELGLALLSAIVAFFFTKTLTHDGMIEEDKAVCPLKLAKMALNVYSFWQFRRYLEENGYDTSHMGLFDSATSTQVEAAEKTDVSSENEKV